MDIQCVAQYVCTSANLEDVVIVADRHMDVWKVCHIHSAHTRIGFVCLCALLCPYFLTTFVVQVEQSVAFNLTLGFNADWKNRNPGCKFPP